MRNILSYIALIFSIVALLLVLCRKEPMPMDWLGVLVGVLAILTTVLLGWQLYSVINLEYFKKDLEEKVKKEVEKITNDTLETFSMTAFNHCILAQEIGNDFLALHFFANTMNIRISMRDFKGAERVIDDFIYHYKDKGIILNSKSQGYIIEAINEVRKVFPNKAKEILELIRIKE